MPTPLLDAREGQCRFPLWGDDETIGDVCGAPTAKGQSFCSACRARVYAPTPTRIYGAPRASGAAFAPNDREPDLCEVIVGEVPA